MSQRHASGGPAPHFDGTSLSARVYGHARLNGVENKEIAAVFTEMADLSEIAGGDRYRIRAFRRIARVLENLREPIPTMIKHGTLARTPGIGEGAVGRIKEILRAGTCAEQRVLRKSLPPGLRDLMSVKGVGVKTVRWLWTHERIGSLDELESAARAGRLSRVPGFGDDSAERILKAIEHARRDVRRFLLAEAIEIGESMRDALREEPSVALAELTGSARRRKETVGDLDILVGSSDPIPVIARFVVLPRIDEVLVRGESKCSARIDTGQQVDIRVLPPEEFGAGLHYFTGSQQHNIYVRARANRRGVKISEHGVFKRPHRGAEVEEIISTCPREEDVFHAVGLPFIPPELRENVGEIEAAEKGRLPTLVEERDLQGELHCTGNPDEMLAAARAMRLGYIALTPRAYEREGGALPKSRSPRLVNGIEVEIMPDGTLDVPVESLRDFEFVVASVRQGFDQPRADMTRRILRAFETGVIDLLAHPTGRIFGERDAMDLDVEKVMKAARRTDVALEVHGDPRRMDLDSSSCRFARELGVRIAVSSGASSPEELANRRYALYTARRGWLEAKDVLNAQPWSEIEKRRRARMKKRLVGVPDEIESEPETPRVDPTEALFEQLALRPLPPEIVERLDVFFREGNDEPLQKALQLLSGNPIMKAYELLVLSQSPLEEEPGHEPES